MDEVVASQHNSVTGGIHNHSLLFSQSTFHGSVHLGNEDKQKCLRDLKATDPRLDKDRILLDKDPLLQGSYTWVIEDEAFQNWWNQDDLHLLWIHGDPGKGKTMLMAGIIKELTSRINADPASARMAYFFCQNGVAGLDDAVSILKGLIFFIATENPESTTYLQQRYKERGSNLFDDLNAFAALWDILNRMVSGLGVPRVYLLIDALDECNSGLQELLKVLDNSKYNAQSRIKWLVTSRNYNLIREYLEYGEATAHTSLEVNSTHVSKTVYAFIDSKLNWLSERKTYDALLKADLQEYLQKSSEDTFLWVSLVCKELEDVPASEARTVIHEFPSGLDPLYDRMLCHLRQTKRKNDAHPALRLLQAVTTSFVSRKVEELAVACEINDENLTAELITNSCASFLILRNGTVYFVHQSARDYFQTGSGRSIFPSTLQQAHLQMAYQCLIHMHNGLKQDFYSLKKIGVLMEEIDLPRVRNIIPLHLQYACKWWVSHLSQAMGSNESVHIETTAITGFFQNKFLQWLESLSLLKGLSEGIHALLNLQKLSQRHASLKHLKNTIFDGWRFAMSYRHVLEKAPLQVYHSALIFTPESSVTKSNYLKSIPAYLKKLPKTDKDWSACLQIIEFGYMRIPLSVMLSPTGTKIAVRFSHVVMVYDIETGQLQSTLEVYRITTMKFSPDGTKIATGSDESIVKVWDVTTGQVNLTLVLEANQTWSDPISLPDRTAGLLVSGVERLTRKISVAFSPDGRKIAAGSDHNTVEIWNAKTGQLQSTLALESYSKGTESVVFSPDGTRVASGSRDGRIQVWDAKTGRLQLTFWLEGSSEYASLLVFSPDGTKIASKIFNGAPSRSHNYNFQSAMCVWNIVKGQIQVKIKHPEFQGPALFSPDGAKIASTVDNSRTIRVWDTMTGQLQIRLESHSEPTRSLAFSPDGAKIVSGLMDQVRVWNAITGQLESTLEGHLDSVNSAIFSLDMTRIISGSDDGTVRVWDATIPQLQPKPRTNPSRIRALEFSPEGTKIALGLREGTVQIYHAKTGQLQSTLQSRADDEVYSVAFSPDGMKVTSGSGTGVVYLWDITTNQLQFLLLSGQVNEPGNPVQTVIFSPGGAMLAAGSYNGNIRVWSAITGQTILKPEANLGPFYSIEFSSNEMKVVAVFGDGTAQVWDIKTTQLQLTILGRKTRAIHAGFSPDATKIASISTDTVVRIWDASDGSLIQTLDEPSDPPIFFTKDNLNAIWSKNSWFGLDDRQHDFTTGGAASPYDLSIHKDWILYRGSRLLWLPKHVRPKKFAKYKNMLAFSYADGQFTVFHFQDLEPDDTKETSSKRKQVSGDDQVSKRKQVSKRSC